MIKSRNRFFLIIFCSCISFLLINFKAYSQGIDLGDRSDLAKEINALYNKGNWDAGKQLVDNSLKKHPKDSDLKMLLGKYYLHKKQYDKSRYELNKALEFNPANVDAKQMLVTVETDTKRYSSAICFVNELLEVNPYWRGLWNKKVELYKLQGNDVEASRLLKRMAQIYPEDTNIKKDYLYQVEQEATAKRKEGKIDDAIALNKQLIASAPKNVNYYLDLINNFIKVGDQYNALSYAERGLNEFPNNLNLVQKKVALLEGQKRYDELLSFLQQQMKAGGNSAAIRQQYNYFLLEAARNAKDKDPSALYGKILEGNPGHDEAFNYVLNHAIAQQQYEQALYVLGRYRNARGQSKVLYLKELTIYKRLGDAKKSTSLAIQLFNLYPNDQELKESYVQIMLKEAKDRMEEESYLSAIDSWKDVLQYGDKDMRELANQGMFNAYFKLGNYNESLNALNEVISNDPEDLQNYVRRADIYQKLKRYHNAAASYEYVLTRVENEKKDHYLSGYEELMTLIVKDLNDKYLYDEVLEWTDRWLKAQNNSQQALLYAINAAYIVKNKTKMLELAQKAEEFYPDDVLFKVKLAEAMKSNNSESNVRWSMLHQQLIHNPYNEPLIKAFTQTSDEYATQLIKNQQSYLGLKVLDTALIFNPDNKELKYRKGLAFEKLKLYDSAHYYQSFYSPGLLELSEFKQHLNFLNQKSYRNEVGVYHLKSRFGDHYSTTSISTIEYTRFAGKNTYSGRVNYAGRDNGRGLQAQAEWSRVWDEKTHTRLDLAVADRFFPSLMANGSVFRTFRNTWEAELGLGYRQLFTEERIVNLAAGVTKELESFRLNAKFNTYLIDELWHYNVSAQARYYMSTPKNYLMIMGSVGTAPEAELLDMQLYPGISPLNSMVGAGFGHILTKQVSAGVVGNWYTFQGNSNLENPFRNLFNLYFQLHVSF